MSRSWAKGSTAKGRKIRLYVLQRDGWLCQLQLEHCTTKATDAHHLDGKRAGDHPARMVAACAWCNGHTGDPTRHDPPPQPLERW